MTLLEFYAFRSSLYLNYSVLIFAFQVCNQNLVIKIYCDRDRNFLVRHRFFGFRAIVDCSLRKHVDRQPNFRPRMEACETEDGGRLLVFYTSEAEEEIVALVLWTTSWRGIYDSTWVNGHHAWWYVSLKMEIKLLGFAYWRPKKGSTALVSQKDWEKLTDLKGGSDSCDSCGFW